jgi:hypothetical protein
MKNSIRVIAIVFTLLVGGAAWAAEIFTPAITTGTADSVSCRVLNTGTTTADDVRIEIRDGTTGVLDIGGNVNIETRQSRAVTPISDPLGVVYCRVSGIPKAKARVSL